MMHNLIMYLPGRLAQQHLPAREGSDSGEDPRLIRASRVHHQQNALTFGNCSGRHSAASACIVIVSTSANNAPYLET
jgi:L-asparaginase II